ncbi:hypothetical protein [Paenibacillus polymyxa]|uniref:hypothetical protein n=1 Tax=Paenibacillus polymyxa TaxID=1406 RepID=UPI000589B20B|nr:hypothetical protein [Paenibacillus polymyxa]AJE54229.1 hypothetical protein RE92_24880 [Paenibacillus polymyxa]
MKKQKMAKKQWVGAFLTFLGISPFWSSRIYASSAPSGFNVGTKVNDVIYGNVSPVIPGIVLAISTIFFFKRDWIKMTSFIGLALCLGYFSDWNSVKELSHKLFTAIMP